MELEDITLSTSSAPEAEAEDPGDSFIDALVAVDVEGRGVVLGFFNTPGDYITEDFDSLWGDYSSRKVWEEEPGLYRVKANFTCTRDYYGEADCELEIETIQELMCADPVLLTEGWHMKLKEA